MPSNENKRELRDMESEDSSIECDCIDRCLCGNLGTPQLQMNVEMQASTEQSSKQHQIPNAWNTPTRVLTDLEHWPKLAIVSPLAANEMIMPNKLGSPNADQRREVIGTKQRKSVENVRACSNEDFVELHMEDTQSGKDECLDGDTTTISSKPLQAWSSLLKEEINKVSKMKYKIGAHKIENLVDGMYNVPIEISKKGFSHWENALVGYFIDKRFSFHYVKTWAEKLWGNFLEDVVSIDNGFFIFKVKSEEAIEKILEDGLYYVGARLIVVKKWQPGLKLTKCEFSSVPLWVKLYNVPLELWTEEGLGYIASIMGTPLYLDVPIFKRSRLTFVRICIEVPANKEIPKSFKINIGYGDPYEIHVEVPWKPQRCDGCKTFGHATNLCPQKPKTLNPPSSKQEWRVKETNIQGEMQCFTPSISNAFDVLESCDMGELGNGELNQELLCQTKSLQSRGAPSPSDPINEETTKEDNRRILKAKLHYLKSARGKF
ncbi:unnamed protein product [Camellia sinensis]